MAKTEILGTLTIAANTSMSAAMSKSVYDPFTEIAVFPPSGFPAASGSAYLLATYETSQSFTSGTVVPNNDWFVVQSKYTGTKVTISGGQVIPLEGFPFEQICLSGSVKPTVAMTYTVMGQREVAVTGVSALQSDV